MLFLSDIFNSNLPQHKRPAFIRPVRLSSGLTRSLPVLFLGGICLLGKGLLLLSGFL